jgi:hypothetical protein
VLGDCGLVKRHDPAIPDDRSLVKQSAGPGMPRCYRTPDLVAYLKGGPPPSPKSDVFQLGLVLAELFTGRTRNGPSRVMLLRHRWRSRRARAFPENWENRSAPSSTRC